MDGAQRPETSFNTGQVRDAESSNGWAAKLDGALFEERLRFGGNFARSSFDNPSSQDPELTAGLPVVPVEKRTDSAWFAEVAGDLLRDFPIFDERYANVTLYGTHETVQPEFKTLGAITNTNSRNWVAGMQSDLAGVALIYEYQNNRDNLDDLDNILTTRSLSHLVGITVPAASLVNAEKPIWWLPVASYTFFRLHQFGQNSPTFLSSGFTSANIPDQVTSQHIFTTDWLAELWSVSYDFAHSFQDDQRSGVPDEDIRDTSHEISVALLPCALSGTKACEALLLDFGGLFIRQEVEAQDVTRRSQTGFVNLDWTFWSDITLNSNFAYTHEGDSNDDLERDAYTMGAGLAWQTSLPVPRIEPRPIRTFLQFNGQVEKVDDNLFGFDQDVRSWTLLIGFSVAVF